MYLLVVYDIKERRVVRILKFLRQYLHWVQNSVFEGEISDKTFNEIQAGVKKIIKVEEDSIIFYKLASEHNLEKEIIGLEKNSLDTML